MIWLPPKRGLVLPSKQRGFLLNPYRFGGGGGSYGLDSYATGLWAAYGLSKVMTYAGSAVRVRRSNDNAEQDIGFSGNSFDSASLASFVGANSAFVTTWYDQTGNSRHMLQATSGRQPRIVNAGTPDSAIVFNPSGLDDFLLTSATGSSSVDSKSIFRRYLTRARNTVNINFEYGDGAGIGGSGANQIQMNDSDSVGFRMIGYIAANATSSSYWEKRHNTVDQVTAKSNGMIFRKGQANSDSGVLAYQDGSVLTASAFSGSGTYTGNFPAYSWSLGARASAADYGSQISMYSCAIYDADKSADALAINAILDAL